MRAERGEHRGDHRAAAVQLQLGDVLAGLAASARETTAPALRRSSRRLRDRARARARPCAARACGRSAPSAHRRRAGRRCAPPRSRPAAGRRRERRWCRGQVSHGEASSADERCEIPCCADIVREHVRQRSALPLAASLICVRSRVTDDRRSPPPPPPPPPRAFTRHRRRRLRSRRRHRRNPASGPRRIDALGKSSPQWALAQPSLRSFSQRGL